MIKKIFSFVFFAAIIAFYFCSKSFAQNNFCSNNDYLDSFEGVDSCWVDSVFYSLTPEERIGQLFMIAAYSERSMNHWDAIADQICEYNIGGVIFFKGSPIRHAKLCNYLQSNAKTPLLVSIDGEWGLSMRIDSTINFPRQMTLGAIQDDSIVYKMGTEIGRQCKRIGIHMNFAPDIDVNNNPMNPVINNRSFGEDKYQVARKGLMYMNGMQDQHILANAKHFPGHGDTESDSHFTLPIVKSSLESLDTLELYPFKELFKAGVKTVMAAHLYVPSLDSTKNKASSLSKKIITDLLKTKMGFKGLVITDALNMQGAAKYFKPGELEVEALKAGNDILLYPEDVPTAIYAIEKAIQKGYLTEEEINLKCKKILASKYWVGLNHYKPINLENLVKDISPKEAELMSRKIIEKSITVLNNKNGILPVKNLDTLCIASLSFGEETITPFQEMLSNYAYVMHFNIAMKDSNDRHVIDSIITQLTNFNFIIVGIHSRSNRPSRNYGVFSSIINIIDSISKNAKLVVDLFGNPYGLNSFEGIEKVDGLVLSFQNSMLTQDISAQLIFGGVEAHGRLPVSASKYYPIGSGIDIDTVIRFKYTIPEEMGLSSSEFSKIDSIVHEGINKKAFPGCQVLVARKGKVIYNKSFGNHTYDFKINVKNSNLYDLASLTKVLATTPAIMRLYEKKQIDLNGKLADYLVLLENSNKKNLKFRDVLTHQAGLVSWIPFFKKTVDRGQIDERLYRTEPNDTFSIQVCYNLFLRNDYRDTILKEILESKLNKKKEFIYSDLGFYLMRILVDSLTKTPFQDYVNYNFYAPLGMSSMGYNPTERFSKNTIAPTENDQSFRKQLIHGYVHDQGAAMLGGISGHAGLFSNANDVAKIMQMMLQKGYYGGVRYFKPETVCEFTRCQFCEDGNRRALGFDKPAIKGGAVTCESASPQSFGHSGFTGTYTWVDPKEELVYVFLSNRVYPDSENKKLANMNIRTNIQQVVYDAIKKAKK